MQLIVHGGAGSRPEEPEARRAVLDDAAARGAEAATPLEAVETAVNVLEGSPRFNAGVGGAIQSDGAVRTDAGIMTDDRAVGAVCSMPGVERAVSAARVVLEETPHAFVSGEHAVALAERYGVETGVDLRSERTRERWAELEDEAPDGDVRAQLGWIRERFGRTDPGGRDEGRRDVPEEVERSAADEPDAVPADRDHDTVGAVGFDGDSLAAATSTGGRWLALAGRVGDVPQVGSGFYCSPAGGASATGAGEDIARVTLSRRVVRHLERGLEADAAADLAIEEFAELTGSSAGVICIDARGRLGSAYNSDGMQTSRSERRSPRGS